MVAVPPATTAAVLPTSAAAVAAAPVAATPHQILQQRLVVFQLASGNLSPLH